MLKFVSKIDCFCAACQVCHVDPYQGSDFFIIDHSVISFDFGSVPAHRATRAFHIG